MSKHKKIMSSFETSILETQPLPRTFDESNTAEMQEDNSALEEIRLRLLREEEDIGNEGNKSTYLRPSRNRDMSSLSRTSNT
jgi:hypothetical protein